MDFYFNIVTVVNFLTSVINAIVLTVCYRKRKDLLSGIVTVAMETLTHPKETQALQLSDDVFTTDNPVTYVNSSTTDTQIYSMPLIFLIVLLSMLVTFALYWIFVLIIKPLMSKSNTCRYIFPCSRSHTDFLTPATDLFLDIVHVNSGEQIRVFLTTIAPQHVLYPLQDQSKFQTSDLLKRIYSLHCILTGIIVFFITMNTLLLFLQKEQLFVPTKFVNFF